ncbi:MAG TPA: ATP-binding cassette domain-containing protein [Firmicutes bacterium]|nr:ATP-binding cassette domain-containing protein [Bacillota bacterium]
MLDVNRLTKVFYRGSINERVALDNISLNLEEGQFTTIIGGNGAGKSTLLKCIAGIYPVESGRIYLNGQEITRFPDYQRATSICHVFQDPMVGTAASLTVEENLALALRRGEKRRLRWAITDRGRAIFKNRLLSLQLGLEERLNSPVKLLSGGQRQALALLMTTLKKPKLALLDEHTASLDPKTANTVLDLTQKLIENQGITTLMVTHNMEQALRMGHRTIMMHEGKIILDVSGTERNNLTVSRLVDLFYEASGEVLQQDRLLLTKSH